MAEKDDQGVFHSGHTQIMGEGDIPGQAPQAPQAQPSGQAFSKNDQWSAHTQALPPEAFDGLDLMADTSVPAMPGAPNPNQGGQTQAMPMDGPPAGQPYNPGGQPQGGQHQGGQPQGGYGQAPPPYGQQQQQAPPQAAPAASGGVPYLETQAIDVSAGGWDQSAPQQQAPQQAAPASSGGGVPYLETQAIDVSAGGWDQQAPQQQAPQQQAPQQHAPQQHAPQQHAPPPQDEHAATVMLDTASVNDQFGHVQAQPPAGPPNIQQIQPPPAQNSQFDSSGMAVGGEKTVMLGDLSNLDMTPVAAAPVAPQQSGKLVIFVPETEPIMFELMPGITTVGRGMENHLVLGDPYASRKHLVITCKNGFFSFEDTGSDNGTVVNGQTCKAAPLKTGDVVEIGSVQMRFVQGPVLPQHQARPAPTPPSGGTGTMAPQPAQKQGGNKGQMILLGVLVLATVGLIAVMVVIMMNR